MVLCFTGMTAGAHGLDFSVEQLDLTRKESRWLRENRVVTVAGPRAFPPFHYFDNKGNLQGMSSDYLFAIMEKLGLEANVAADIPWPRVLEMAQAGSLDLIPCIARTSDREQFLAYSMPYLSFPLVILSRRDAPFIGGIEDLYGKTLAVVKNNAIQDWLRRDKIQFTSYMVDSPLRRMEAISLGRVDAGIENLAAASYLIQTHGLVNVKVAAPTPYGTYDLHMAVRKDLPEFLGILDKALERITPEQHMQLRSKWLSVRYEHGIRQEDLIRWTLLITAAASVLLGGVLLWNRTLKREMARRRELIDQLEKALAEIRTLEGIVPICSSCKKIRDDEGYWKLIETYIEEHSGASFSHGICPECSDRLYGDKKWYQEWKKKAAAKTSF